MKQYINITRVSENLYDVYFENKSYLGQFLRDVDGDFYYWPGKKDGCWSSWSLGLISEKLEELNREYKLQIQEGNAPTDDSEDPWDPGTFI